MQCNNWYTLALHCGVVTLGTTKRGPGNGEDGPTMTRRHSTKTMLLASRHHISYKVYKCPKQTTIHKILKQRHCSMNGNNYHRHSSSVNFRGGRHFCPKNMYEKLTKCRILRDSCPKIIKSPELFNVFARKVNKIPEFHMSFARKCPNFT